MGRTVAISTIAISLVYIYFSSALSAAAVEGCSSEPPRNYTYSWAWSGYYKLEEEARDWKAARLACEEEGAVLATPYDLKQTGLMQKIIRAHKLTSGVYIGVRRTQLKGYFNTFDGRPLCHIPHEWAAEEPNFEAAESCATLLADGTLADEPCAETRPYICYKKLQPCYSCLNLCKTKDPAYKYEQRTGSCYKFHTNARTWGDAVDTCPTEGGHLVIINSDVESRVLKELFSEHAPECILDATQDSVLHVGFHQLFKKSCWRNIDGHSLWSSGFRTWAPYQPDAGAAERANGGSSAHAYVREDCGSILRSGLLNDIACDSKCAFVCEIEVSPAV